MRVVHLVMLVLLTASCTGTKSDSQPRQSQQPYGAPGDAAHKNLQGPHGDHSPHHGGLVLMNGDVHYEVLFARDGRHEIWFSDAVRSDLPASVATGVTMEVARPGAAPETIALTIGDTGESWVAAGRPLESEGAMVKIRYALQGEPHEIEVPVVAPRAPGLP